ncbi:MAG: DUF4258 domain-containing protein [Allomuricauda sp.]|nr:MAG: DUF4258 domain-containing protein [Allomuricauda sp.]
MAFLKRLGWYLVGLSIGLIFLVFLFKKKSEESNVEFCYLPNCRVLKDMRTKKLVLSDKAISQLTTFELDTLIIRSTLEDGSIDFSNSDTKSKPCKTYLVNTPDQEKEYQMRFSNCDSLLTLTEVLKK